MTTKEAVLTKETVTAKMSRWAASLQYTQLSKDAVYQAKRLLLDSVGCALGGYQQHDVKIALSVVDETAVITWLIGFSSACAIDPRLTTPPAARANVHLLNFIRSSCDDVLVRFYQIQAQKTVCP